MKSVFIFLLSIAFFLFLCPLIKAQVDVDVKGKVKDQVKDRANDRTDEAIDKSLDKIEEGVGSIFKKKDKKNKSESDEQKEEKAKSSDDNENQEKASESKSQSTAKGNQPALSWAKYDFVPGDKIIFEDNQENEQNGEFPSRWDLSGGVIENASLGTSNVIYFKETSSKIVPFIKNSNKDYLPDIFTVEFDAWFETDEYCSYLIHFYDQKNQSETKVDLSPLVIGPNTVKIYQVGEGHYPGKDDDEITNSLWRHIAISFNVRALKVYIDDARVLNIPNLGQNPEGITIECDGMNTAGAKGINRFIKNIRIAQGGVKLYDKLLANGKIVTNGIKFDVNKSTIKPESMGVINSIVQLMKEHTELKFSVEGHTDSDGDDASNQELSEQRAKAVVDKLTNLGIAPNRLSSKGFGESKPMDNNSTSEGKANNRRVEFVKI
jgi:outer membrane protein OmpA-like peptidoglycan-associated protein